MEGTLSWMGPSFLHYPSDAPDQPCSPRRALCTTLMRMGGSLASTLAAVHVDTGAQKQEVTCSESPMASDRVGTPTLVIRPGGGVLYAVLLGDLGGIGWI